MGKAELMEALKKDGYEVFDEAGVVMVLLNESHEFKVEQKRLTAFIKEHEYKKSWGVKKKK